MLNNVKNSDNFNYKGHELFIASMRDQFQLVHTRARPVVTSFLSLSEQDILLKIKPKEINVVFDGGFDNAIRKVAIIQEDDYTIQSDVVCLVSEYNSHFKELSHRDILGALMHLGIERNQLGDFVVDQNRLYVFCKKKISEYIMDHCTLIGRCPVHFQITSHVELHALMMEEIQIIVSSTRADAIIAQLAHCSRSDAATKIKQGLIKVNDIELEENKQLCFNDVVSIRRVGKFQFKEISNTTKKNRLICIFNKFV